MRFCSIPVLDLGDWSGIDLSTALQTSEPPPPNLLTYGIVFSHGGTLFVSTCPGSCPKSLLMDGKRNSYGHHECHVTVKDVQDIRSRHAWVAAGFLRSTVLHTISSLYQLPFLFLPPIDLSFARIVTRRLCALGAFGASSGGYKATRLHGWIRPARPHPCTACFTDRGRTVIFQAVACRCLKALSFPGTVTNEWKQTQPKPSKATTSSSASST